MKDEATNPKTVRKHEDTDTFTNIVQVKIFGGHDTLTQQLHEHVARAFDLFPVAHKLIAVSDPDEINQSSIQQLPVLMMDTEVISAGVVPTVDEIVNALESRFLKYAKLFRLKTITIPVDISDISGDALRFGWKMAQYTGSSLDVLYVMDSIFEGGNPSASGFLSSYNKTMLVELDSFIRDELAKINVSYIPTPKGDSINLPNIRSKVIYGFPDTAIIEYSKSSDLIVMGAAGRGALAKKLFGSVSTEVSRSAHCPVLFIPENAMFLGFKHVLYSSDFESLDPLRITQAVRFAKRFDGQMHFVHVGEAVEDTAKLEEKIRTAIYKNKSDELPFTFDKVLGEDVVGQLYDFAASHKTDLLVFVTHQRSFWESLLHKSVTRQAISHATLPILIMHSDDDMAS